DQVAKLAVRIEFVEKTVGVARPGHELVLHLDARLLGEILVELDQRIGGIPGRPTQGQCLCLRRETGKAANAPQQHGPDQGQDASLHWMSPPVRESSRLISNNSTGER